jgi:hypothetical protein
VSRGPVEEPLDCGILDESRQVRWTLIVRPEAAAFEKLLPPISPLPRRDHIRCGRLAKGHWRFERRNVWLELRA